MELMLKRLNLAQYQIIELLMQEICLGHTTYLLNTTYERNTSICFIVFRIYTNEYLRKISELKKSFNVSRVLCMSSALFVME